MTRLLLAPVVLLLGWLVVWLDGRLVIEERRSPAFAERWWGYLTRLVALGGLLVTAMVVGISPHMWSLGLALTAAALLLAHYPVRRAAYGETWGLGRYVATAARRGTAFFGFWVLLAVTPQLIVAVPGRRWLVASMLAALLLGALRYRREIVLDLVRATPLPHAPEGFAQVLGRASLPVPVTVYRAGVTGGLWAEAFALPSPRGHAVVLGDSLLETLDPEALAAIFALEVARLERCSRRMSQVAAVQTGLALAAVGAGLGLLQLPAERALLGATVWGCVVVIALAIHGVGRAGDGRRGDLRAAALCEDAPALVRALTIVHALRRIPRRLSAFGEETSIHPSLARRLQAIREAADIAPATLATPVVLSSPDLDRVVVLDAERAQWLEGLSARIAREPEAVRTAADSIRSLAYRQLSELRLVAGVRGTAWLTATHRSGRSWRTPIRRQDVAAAQAALDVVDERLAPEPVVTQRRAVLLVLFAAVAAASAWAQVGASPVVVLAAFVAARPRWSPGWPVGLLILVWALQAAAPETAVPTVLGTLTAALMAAGAMAFVVGPLARRRAALRPTPGETTAVAGTLVAFALVLGAAVLLVARSAAASIPSWRFHAVALALLAAAAVVALGRARRRWISVAAAAVLGVAVLRWGPLALAAWAPLASGSPLAVQEAPAPAGQVVALPASARRLVLSPSAGQFAVQVGRSRASLPDDVVIGRIGGPQRPLSAYDLAFLDETVALLVGDHAAGGLELRTVPLDPSDLLALPGWSLALPVVSEPRVSADASSGAWTVVGWHPDGAEAMSVAGRVGEDTRDVRRWLIPGVDPHASFHYLAATGSAFSVARATLPLAPALLSRLAGVPEDRWELWKLDGRRGVTVAATAAALACLDPLPRDETLLCLARHAAHTVIWSVDGRTGAITALGTVGRVRLARLGPGHARLLLADGAILRVPRGGGPASRLTPAAEFGEATELASTASHVAVLARARAGARLSLYETP